MRIVFDPQKDAVNRRKHGLSLAFAQHLEWERAVIRLDARIDYGEDRLVALVPRECELYCAVFVERADGRRIISLRRANARERTGYVSTITATDDSTADT